MDEAAQEQRAALRALLRERALIRESVVLSSGKRSSHYFDARQVLLIPRGRRWRARSATGRWPRPSRPPSGA